MRGIHDSVEAAASECDRRAVDLTEGGDAAAARFYRATSYLLRSIAAINPCPCQDDTIGDCQWHDIDHYYRPDLIGVVLLCAALTDATGTRDTDETAPDE